MRMVNLQPGWQIVGNDGHRIATIRDVGQNYVVAKRGFGRDLYVPVSAIANVENETVRLNLSKRQVEEMGWEQPPRSEDEVDATPESDLHRHV